MRRGLLVGFSLVLPTCLIAGALAQLPDSSPPAAPQGVTPGNLDLNAIQKDVAAFGADASKLAPMPHAPTAIPPRSALPTPSFGYIHQFGSFQISSGTADAMFMLSATLPFPDGRRTVDFYHASLTYSGKYIDQSSGISGYLYSTDIGPPVNDRRYFLFGDRDLNVQDPNSNGTRWVVYYNGQGQRTFFSTARFYRP